MFHEPQCSAIQQLYRRRRVLPARDLDGDAHAHSGHHVIAHHAAALNRHAVALYRHPVQHEAGRGDAIGDSFHIGWTGHRAGTGCGAST